MDFFTFKWFLPIKTFDWAIDQLLIKKQLDNDSLVAAMDESHSQ